jgi:hypothetical protein
MLFITLLFKMFGLFHSVCVSMFILYSINGYNIQLINCRKQTVSTRPYMTPNDEMIDVIEPKMKVMSKDFSKPNSTRLVEWLPFGDIKAPVLLDGTMAGDVGFDPFGFSKSLKTLYWMREAELKHGRLAMLAAIGWPLSELWHKPIAAFFHLDSLLAYADRAPSILNGGLSSIYASSMLMASIVIAGYLEGKSMESGEVFWNAEKSEQYKPGNLNFDPLELYNKRDGDKKSMETAEIKHGRLAMIAITAYVAQELVTGMPVVEQTPYLF